MDREKYLYQQFNKYGIDLTKDKIKDFIEVYDIMLDQNNKQNLTTITNFDDVVVKHYIDSCMAYNIFKKDATVVDVGSGAGFPAIPLKIVRPDLNFTLVDSLQKRIDYLNNLIQNLKLYDIQAVHYRAEDFANVSHETFDYAVARAVANMATLSEYCLPLVKVGGKFIAYKTNVEKELSEAKYAIELLGGEIEEVVNYVIEGNSRSLVIIKKVKNTPKGYPRGKNKPRTNPLCQK